MGWRLYVTNTNKEQLSLTEAVSAYQEQWQPERGFHRFKKGRLSALPIYFRDEDKIKGLMFLLTIALRVFTLMEFVVRRQLRQSQSSLAGLYDGNPKRSTDRPTAEQMLKAFRNLTLSDIPHPKLSQREITERKNQSEHKNKHKERKKAFEKQ